MFHEQLEPFTEVPLPTSHVTQMQGKISEICGSKDTWNHLNQVSFLETKPDWRKKSSNPSFNGLLCEQRPGHEKAFSRQLENVSVFLAAELRQQEQEAGGSLRAKRYVQNSEILFFTRPHRAPLCCYAAACRWISGRSQFFL